MFKNIKDILPHKPLIRSTFDVYLSEDLLIYIKEPCVVEDTQGFFSLYFYPTDASDLTDTGYGNGKWFGYNRVFLRLNSHGFRSAERCVVLGALPDYPIARIRTGQFLREDGSPTRLWVWEGEVRFDE